MCYRDKVLCVTEIKRQVRAQAGTDKDVKADVDLATGCQDGAGCDFRTGNMDAISGWQYKTGCDNSISTNFNVNTYLQLVFDNDNTGTFTLSLSFSYFLYLSFSLSLSLSLFLSHSLSLLIR